jgi:hypothetical protein
VDKVSKARLARYCPFCASPLETFEGERYCADCLAYRHADPDVYLDAEGVPWRPFARVPYRELTAGSRYVLPCERTVRVKQGDAAAPTLLREYPSVWKCLANGPVLLLERVPTSGPARLPDDPDDLVWIEDDPEPPPACPSCGQPMVRVGPLYVCDNCDTRVEPPGKPWPEENQDMGELPF